MRQFSILFATVIIVILSCGSLKPFSTMGQDMVLNGLPTGMVRLALSDKTLRAISPSTTHFRISIGGPAIAPPIEASMNLKQSCLQVLVPAGSERSVVVEALDQKNEVVGILIQTGLQIQKGQCTVVNGASGWTSPSEIQP